MNFISLIFLGFLLLSILVYFLTPKNYRWISLLILSLVCYFYAGWVCFIYLIAISLFSYLAALLIGKIKEKTTKDLENIEDKDEKEKIRKKSADKSRLVLILTIVILIGLLAFLKYADSLFSFISSFTNSDVSLSLIVPLGISFYLFQSLGYVVDVYRDTTKYEKNFFHYLLFISYFPQLIQGPIERYNDLKDELFIGHDFDSDNFAKGIERIIIGFIKKIVIADTIASFVTTVKTSQDSQGVIILIMLLAYSIELYCDFSGFIDIAIGISTIFGIKLTENFKTPYLSCSIAEFWRRWHITLGTWFKDYVYYSIMTTSFAKKLIKKRKLWASNLITTIALLAVWVSMGLWHGSTLNFLIYGLYHGFFIITSNLLNPIYKKIKKFLHIDDKALWYKAFQVIRTFLIVTFGYVFFITDSLSSSFSLISRMFSSFNPLLIASEKYLTTYSFSFTNVIIIFLAIVIIIIYSKTIKAKIEASENPSTTLTIQRCSIMILAILLIIFSWISLYAAGDYSSDFVYFQF